MGGQTGENAQAQPNRDRRRRGLGRVPYTCAVPTAKLNRGQQYRQSSCEPADGRERAARACFFTRVPSRFIGEDEFLRGHADRMYSQAQNRLSAQSGYMHQTNVHTWAHDIAVDRVIGTTVVLFFQIWQPPPTFSIEEEPPRIVPPRTPAPKSDQHHQVSRRVRVTREKPGLAHPA